MSKMAGAKSPALSKTSELTGWVQQDLSVKSVLFQFTILKPLLFSPTPDLADDFTSISHLFHTLPINL